MANKQIKQKPKTAKPPRYKYESLKDYGKRWKAAMKHAATGPLVIAQEIVRVGRQWELVQPVTGKSYREEAGGLSCTTWLQEVFGVGHGLGFFERRQRAVERFGEAIRRTVHHDVAKWLLKRVSDKSKDKEVVEMLIREYYANNGNPLSLGQATLRVAVLLGDKAPRAKKDECKRCKELMKILDKYGIDY
jgi:hypothetical protein